MHSSFCWKKELLLCFLHLLCTHFTIIHALTFGILYSGLRNLLYIYQLWNVTNFKFKVYYLKQTMNRFHWLIWFSISSTLLPQKFQHLIIIVLSKYKVVAYSSNFMLNNIFPPTAAIISSSPVYRFLTLAEGTISHFFGNKCFCEHWRKFLER